ncbi:type II secretion system protein K [Marinobacter zhanjiangensis]|uniref:Type II secretion system protein K n=2 Tax=Marinobacter zhanjiangensis TaxID=578215 RepID=A0ABQ3ATC1_9GAMM|nr:type II secretion system protein K [Marinobacter zhanjiangensis]
MALIMVLLSMALIVMMIAGMMQQQSVRVFRAGHFLAQNQGYSIALGAESFAKQILFQDLESDREDNEPVDSPDELWWKHSAVLPLDDGGVAEVQIDDLSGRINLNDLVSPTGAIDQTTRDRLMRLLMVLGITDVHVDALIDWIDPDEEPLSAYGAEDGQYLMKEPPYRAANQPFASVTELRLIEGMTEEAYRLLRPHVAALPVSGTGINVNMASTAVIRSLHQQISEAQAKAVAERREEEPFLTTRDFTALPEFAGLGLKPRGLNVSSEFFDVVSRITWNGREVNLVSTMYRSRDGEFAVVRRDTGQKHRITKEPYGVSEE